MELGIGAFGDANWDPRTGTRISEAQAIRNVVESAVLAEQVRLDWFELANTTPRSSPHQRERRSSPRSPRRPPGSSSPPL